MMKKRLATLLFAAMAVVQLAAQTGGILFVEDTWANILTKAKAEQKIIFIDAFAVWCGPCKLMAKEIFPLDEAGAFYNQAFISTKFDMERGEGLALREKFEVNAYPTFLFVNADGELLHKGIGARDLEGFLALGKAATDPNAQLITLQKRYNGGERNSELLKNYANALRDAGSDEYNEISAAYLKTLDTWNTSDAMTFIYENISDIYSEPFRYMAQNADAFRERFGEQAFDTRMENIISYNVTYASTLEMDKLRPLINNLFPEKAAQLTDELELNFYLYSMEPEHQQPLVAKATEYFNNYKTTDWELLNTVAWRCFEMFNDIRTLEKAIDWAQQSTTLNENYYNTDTLAALYYKTGNKKKATKTAKRAIQIARANGEDYSETERLLQLIKGNK